MDSIFSKVFDEYSYERKLYDIETHKDEIGLLVMERLCNELGIDPPQAASIVKSEIDQLVQLCTENEAAYVRILNQL